MSAPRCCAPLDDGEDLDTVRLCGEGATEVREVEGVALDLCREHAAELDGERAQN